MSHDPIHDWLDMALRTAGGHKSAHRKYKKNQARERERRANERARRQRNITSDDDVGERQLSDSASDGAGLYRPISEVLILLDILLIG
jgi:hypothetical protein